MEAHKLEALHATLSKLRPGGKKGGLGLSSLGSSVGVRREADGKRKDGLPDNGLYSMFVREGESGHVHQRFEESADAPEEKKKERKKKKKDKKRKIEEVVKDDDTCVTSSSDGAVSSAESKKKKSKKKKSEKTVATTNTEKKSAKKKKKKKSKC